MLATPEINFRRTPVTLILTALALALEVVCTLKPEMRLSYYDEFKLGIWWQIWAGELWRPFTTTVLHGGILHALFNMYWMTVFGPVVEHHFGSYPRSISNRGTPVDSVREPFEPSPISQ